VPFRILAAAAILAGTVCWVTDAVLGTVLSGAVLVYLASLLIAPTWPCRSCGGGKTHSDPLGSRARRQCWTCGGRGYYPRAGVRLLRPQVAVGIRNGEHGRNY